MNTSTLIKRANRLFLKKANMLLKPYGITHAYTFFLMELYQENGLTQSALCKRIGIEQPTAVRTLDRMERDGLIKRIQSPTDRRATLIQLTNKGLTYKKPILACAKDLNHLALIDFSKEEEDMLIQLVSRINHNLSK